MMTGMHNDEPGQPSQLVFAGSLILYQPTVTCAATL